MTSQDQRLRIGKGHERVLELLWNFAAKQGGKVSIERETIASLCKISVGTVSNITSDLVKIGALTKKKLLAGASIYTPHRATPFVTLENHAGMTIENHAGVTLECHAGVTLENHAGMTTDTLNHSKELLIPPNDSPSATSEASSEGRELEAESAVTALEVSPGEIPEETMQAIKAIGLDLDRKFLKEVRENPQKAKVALDWFLEYRKNPKEPIMHEDRYFKKLYSRLGKSGFRLEKGVWFPPPPANSNASPVSQAELDRRRSLEIELAMLRRRKEDEEAKSSQAAEVAYQTDLAAWWLSLSEVNKEIVNQKLSQDPKRLFLKDQAYKFWIATKSYQAGQLVDAPPPPKKKNEVRQ